MRWRRLRAPDLERAFHGVRRQVTESAPSVRELADAYAKRMPRRQVFSHATAAALWGVPLPPLERWGEGRAARPLLDVSVPRGSARPAARGIRGHVIDLDRVAVMELNGLRVVDAASAWVQLGANLGFEDLVAAADFLLTGTEPYDRCPPWCTRADLEDAVARHTGRRGAARLRLALAAARYGSLSRRETFARLDLVAAGLPEPALNHRVALADGTERMIDLAYPEYRVGIEYQSDLHRSPAAWRRDIRRLEMLADAGWTIVQATADDVSGDGRLRGSTAFAERVRARLRSRGWPG
ncbi:hypothetical protein [Agromyces marinus]|uniref:DUF559 domain-containing protein n=1 Tax=Agromyces marinus TaxID=1389020 RepID=A0ABN6YEE0_9MICO|nr:hypothetical protein [Agromyces marinus]UIP59178.1 hypothetical protein DSM26151_20760 [Agromyces marinus]BDZ55822.1 hypothetical protein GCM10025870_28950 [Agromyces marinus]